MRDASCTNEAASEEMHLIALAQHGDRTAVDRIVSIYLPMIASISGHFRISPSIVQRDELIQAGVLGLLRALEKYSPTAGSRLGTYAMAWILGEMRQAIGKAVDSTGVYPILRQVMRRQEELEQRHGCSPSLAELAKACVLSEAELAEVISLANPLKECTQDSGVSLYDCALQEELGDIAKADIRIALAALPEHEQKIIILRYFRDRTQSETAHILGKSQAQISRIERSALDHLRGQLS